MHLGADAETSAEGAVVVLADVDESAGGEVGVDFELLVFQYLDGAFQELAEVVGQDDGGEGDGDAFGALGQKKGKLDGQGDRFLLAAVIGGFPLRGLGVEDHLLGKL